MQLRDFDESDIQLFSDYWFKSPPGVIEGRGVDLKKLGTPEDFKERALGRIQEGNNGKTSQMATLTILWDGRSIGAHPLTHVINGKSASMHAHIWDESLRHKSLGMYSLLIGAKIFFERFQLEEMMFHPAVHNPAPNRLLQKLSLRFLGESVVVGQILRENLIGNLYSMNKGELKVLVQKYLEE
jgi:RimJ/RimL family protein N-acetyltransferase